MPEDAYDLVRRKIGNALRRQRVDLDLGEHQLTVLPPEIGQLRTLQSLRLVGNQLSTLPPEIGQLTSLRFLNLKGNQLRTLPAEIGQLTELERLDLGGNQLSALPPEIGRLTALRFLNLTGNQLSVLPQHIARLTALRGLDLRRNQFSVLPPEILQLPVLRWLRLMKNQLSVLPPEIGQLTTLQSLNVIGNQLSTLPPEIGQLTGLEHLDLAGNKISGLPPEIGRLAALRSLNLTANQLGTLPTEISHLTVLQRLVLRRNRLTALPSEIGALRSLEKPASSKSSTNGLWLEDNPLPPPYPILIADDQPRATANVLAWLRGELDSRALSELAETKQRADYEAIPIPSPEIPIQGFGPHFEIDNHGVITFAPAEALDRQGNNVARLTRLHPTLRALSADLIAGLGRGNIPHWHLRERAEAYARRVDQDLEHVDFSLLYVEGVRLANAEKAAIEKIAEKELPPLDVHVHEVINTLLQVHGTFMLATATGLELLAEEERYQRTPQEEVEYRAAAVDFAQSLQNRPQVIDPQAALFVLGTAEEIGQGANPERSGVVATGTVKNVAITLSTAATLAAISMGAIASGSAPLIVSAGAAVLVVGEGLKKSKSFAAVAALVTKGLDQASETEVAKVLRILRERSKPQLRFVLMAKPQLRRLGQRKGFGWLIRSLDWIEQQAVEDG
jgi:Leucine-rich repeat (LRR) protein